jgi:hypothetical protein
MMNGIPGREPRSDNPVVAIAWNDELNQTRYLVADAENQGEPIWVGDGEVLLWVKD